MVAGTVQLLGKRSGNCSTQPLLSLRGIQLLRSRGSPGTALLMRVGNMTDTQKVDRIREMLTGYWDGDRDWDDVLYSLKRIGEIVGIDSA